MLKQIIARTSGFRDIRGTDGFTPDHSFVIGAELARITKLRAQDARRIYATIHDPRQDAEIFDLASARGLAHARADEIHRLGCGPTGMLAMYLSEVLGAESGGGILNSASHLPPEYMAAIQLNGDGTYCTDTITDPTTNAFRHFSPGCSSRDVGVGRIKLIDARDRYHQWLLRRLDVDQIAANRFRVLIDPGNGTAGEAMKRACEALGCRVDTIHFEPKTIPDRPSECKPESCERAKQMAIEAARAGDPYDAVFCFDGDADRLLIFDETGTHIKPNMLGAIYAHYILEPGEVCVTPVDSSSLIQRVCDRRDATLKWCRIGQPDTGRAVLQHETGFFYEASAKYGTDQDLISYDAIRAALVLLSLMAEKRQKISGMRNIVEMFYGVIHEERRDVEDIPVERSDEIAARTFELVRAEFQGHSGYPVEDTIDGLRITFENGKLLVRPSGTERNKARVAADSTDKSFATQLADTGQRLYQQALAEIQ